MERIVCPNCGAAGIEMYAGFVTGNYICKKCGYIGPVAERIIIPAKRKAANKKSGKQKRRGRAPAKR